MEGIQTPSGLETPSGMASVVSTVAGGLETPDFLELRKAAPRAAAEPDSGPRSLYQVVPEKQTNIRGLMGSERGYDVSSVANVGASIPVLGEERGTKVRLSFRLMPCRTTLTSVPRSGKPMAWTFPSMQRSSKACRRKNCAVGTTSMRVVLRVFLVRMAETTFPS